MTTAFQPPGAVSVLATALATLDARIAQGHNVFLELLFYYAMLVTCRAEPLAEPRTRMPPYPRNAVPAHRPVGCRVSRNGRKWS